MSVYVAVNSDQFTANNINLYYMKPANFTAQSFMEAPSNNPNSLFFGVGFDPHDAEILAQHARASCRFTSKNGTTLLYTKALLMHMPMEEHGPPNTL